MALLKNKDCTHESKYPMKSEEVSHSSSKFGLCDIKHLNT